MNYYQAQNSARLRGVFAGAAGAYFVVSAFECPGVAYKVVSGGFGLILGLFAVVSYPGPVNTWVINKVDKMLFPPEKPPSPGDGPSAP